MQKVTSGWNKRKRQATTLLRAILLHPKKTLLQIIEWKSQEKNRYIIKKYGIAELPTIDLLDVLPNPDETITRYSFLEGASLPTDIILLKGIARWYPQCRYLEIGTWRGESLANVASIATHSTSVDLSPEELRQRNLSENFIQNQGFFIKDLANVQRIFHDSTSFDFSSLNDVFDLIFVDGDHHYDAVRSDTMNAYKLLRNEHSTLVWHDYGFSTEQVRSEVLAAILDGLPPAEHANLYHVSNTLCVILTKKIFRARTISYPSIPDKIFTIKINAQRL